MSVAASTAVWRFSRHKGSELLVMLAIANRSHDDGGGAHPSGEALAKATRLSLRQVRLILKRLTATEDENGRVVTPELTIERGGGPYGCNSYQINLPGLSAPERGTGKRRVRTGGEKIAPRANIAGEADNTPGEKIAPLGVLPASPEGVLPASPYTSLTTSVNSQETGEPPLPPQLEEIDEPPPPVPASPSPKPLTDRPLRPVPKPAKTATAELPGMPTLLPDDFAVTPAMRVMAVEIGVPADRIDTETRKFRAHYRSKPEPRADWGAVWELWMLRSIEMQPRGSPTTGSHAPQPTDRPIANDGGLAAWKAQGQRGTGSPTTNEQTG